jgi:hypothetical protein
MQSVTTAIGFTGTAVMLKKINAVKRIYENEPLLTSNVESAISMRLVCTAPNSFFHHTCCTL